MSTIEHGLHVFYVHLEDKAEYHVQSRQFSKKVKCL